MPVTRSQGRVDPRMAGLPTELLVAVLDCLPWPDLLTARLTCVKWRLLAELTRSWKNRTVVLSGEENCAELENKFKRRYSSVKHILLTETGRRCARYHREISMEARKWNLFNIVWSRPALESLSLNEFFVSEFPEDLFDAMPSRLNSLSVVNTGMTEEQLEWLLAELHERKLPLKSLILREQIELTGFFLSAVSNVESLEIDVSDFSELEDEYEDGYAVELNKLFSLLEVKQSILQKIIFRAYNLSIVMENIEDKQMMMIVWSDENIGDHSENEYISRSIIQEFLTLISYPGKTPRKSKILDLNMKFHCISEHCPMLNSMTEWMKEFSSKQKDVIKKLSFKVSKPMTGETRIFLP